jgi:broad-specificity NMP kinase
LELRNYSEKKIKENLQAEIMEEIILIARDKFSDIPIYEFNSTILSSVEIAQKIDSLIKSLF